MKENIKSSSLKSEIIEGALRVKIDDLKIAKFFSFFLVSFSYFIYNYFNILEFSILEFYSCSYDAF